MVCKLEDMHLHNKLSGHIHGKSKLSKFYQATLRSQRKVMPGSVTMVVFAFAHKPMAASVFQ
ncbi:hypothetical protein M8C21_005844 [Ambrosia artemisiifolia]|uniref:Uncharacterized protein n=1 Tax=Ambrosia artemisiifolia TaxID=4212 RepID=A0AAD5CXV5_AMBAR|nr:hypothetical protein M8C21_005844 [Ambrosia artemisiifolia]